MSATMSSVQILVFQRTAHDTLAMIGRDLWERFANGGAPLENHRGRVDLLVLTVRSGVCEEADAITLDLDANGYLVRREFRLRPLPRHPALFDARRLFIRRYVKHAHHWRPSEALLDHALRQAGAERADEMAST
jgi:hypothetical protein